MAIDTYKHDSIRLTAGEAGLLWSQYQADSMAGCVLNYFNTVLSDLEIRPVLEYALNLSEEHLSDALVQRS